MSDIIRLLPDSVANQIAAGEVIQRPASVVKELVENAIDAGAGIVSVNIRDAGRTLVQVTDNGCGMSAADARLAFERHSTSKISTSEDLFCIRTLGFRGEALASIAAVSEVVLKTRRAEDEVGTRIEVSGSRVKSQEPTACRDGSNFLVRNLFYNVPARRRFLKSDATELRHIITEFHRVVLARPDMEFSLVHNNSEIHNLPATSLKQRIVNVFGHQINQNLIPLHNETSIVKIHGFIGTPGSSKKSYGEQFFFVNNRYMRHPYFHKAVLESFEMVLPPDTIPSYFLFFETDPDHIDINIHPTKTEIKFEEERAIFQILLASVREALGRHNLIPALDFDREGTIDIPHLNKDRRVKIPEIEIDPDFNPFQEKPPRRKGEPYALDAAGNWEKLYPEPATGLPGPRLKPGNTIQESTRLKDGELNLHRFIQINKRYIITPVKSGLLVVDQKRAHERILYEKFLQTLSGESRISQQDLYPRTIRLNAADHLLFMEIIDDICSLGFDIRDLGSNSIAVNGLPPDAAGRDPAAIIEEFLEYYKQTGSDIKSRAREALALSMARASAIPYLRTLEATEMREIVDQLFSSADPGATPDGRRIYIILGYEEIEKRF